MKGNLGIAIILVAIVFSLNSSGKEGLIFLLTLLGIGVSVAENTAAIVRKCRKSDNNAVEADNIRQ
jgi:hypothetical protein